MKPWIYIAACAMASLLFMALVVWVVTRMIPDCTMYVVTEIRDGEKVTHLECRQ